MAHRPMGLAAGSQPRESGMTALRHAAAFFDEEVVRSRGPRVPATCRMGGIDRYRHWAIPGRAVVELEMDRCPGRLQGRPVLKEDPGAVATVPGCLSMRRGWESPCDFGLFAREVWSSCPIRHRLGGPAWGQRVRCSTAESWAGVEAEPRVPRTRVCPEEPRRDVRDPWTSPAPCPGGSSLALRVAGRASDSLRRPGKKPWRFLKCPGDPGSGIPKGSEDRVGSTPDRPPCHTTIHYSKRLAKWSKLKVGISGIVKPRRLPWLLSRFPIEFGSRWCDIQVNRASSRVSQSAKRLGRAGLVGSLMDPSRCHRISRLIGC